MKHFIRKGFGWFSTEDRYQVHSGTYDRRSFMTLPAALEYAMKVGGNVWDKNTREWVGS